MNLKPGFLLNNRYRIISILGQGGMGAVYRALDENLKYFVAVKENLFLSEEYSRQFQREAEILARLRHPSLPRVGDYFSISNQGQYLVMDYIEGEDLRQRIDRLRFLPEIETALIGVAICDALEYLHSLQPPIIHRDIKPGNIKITPDGDAALVDFGLAKVMSGNQATTTAARAMTPGYSPPEQYGTARTDPRSDVYSLGATLYASLTGIIPEDALSRATGKASLTPLKQSRPEIHEGFAKVIEKSLSIEPDDRFSSAKEFKEAIKSATSLSEMIMPRHLITPPPVGETDPHEDYLNLINNPIFSKQGSISSKKKKPSRLWKTILVSGLIVAGLGYLLFIYLSQGRFPVSLEGFVLPRNPLTITSETMPAAVTPNALDKNLLTSTPETMSPGLPIMTETPLPTNIPSLQTDVAATPFGSGSGKISFVTNRTGIFQIWLMDADGKNQRQLTSLRAGACQPDWSPDGSRLVVISPCSGKNYLYLDTKIYILNADGSNPIPVPITQEGDFSPVWSPEGERIAFTSLRSGVSHIFIYNLTDKTLSEISDTRFADMMPAWNPTGKQLAIVRKNLYNHIWMISDTGQTQFQFSSSGNVNDLWPVWSSDGEFLLYSRNPETASIPYLLKYNYEDRTTGAEVRIPPISSGFGPVAKASLSYDKTWIAFESWPDGNNHDIYRMDLDGNDITRLTTDPGIDFYPVWQPEMTFQE